MNVLKGSVDVTTYFHLRLAADGTDAVGLTLANVDMQYTRNRTAPTAKVDCVALAATDTAHTDNRGIEIDATDQPGLYRFDWPDAAFASGVDKVLLTIKVATAFTETLQVDLVNYNPEDGVRLGLTALPNAAPDAAGGLPISDAGGLDLDAKLANTNEVTAARMGALTDWINGGRLDLILDIIAADTTTDIPALIAALQAVADAIKAKTDNLPSDPADQSLIIAATDAVMTRLGVAGAGLTAIPWNAAWDAEVQSEATDALNAYDPPTRAELTTDINTVLSDTNAILVDTAEIGAAGAGLTAADDAVMVRLGAPAGASVSADVAAVKVDTAATLVDTGTTLDGRIPAALVGGRMDSNASAISGSATAADNLEGGSLGLVVSTCAAGSTTTSIVTNLTEATDDHYNGRVITFTSGALLGQSSSISDYVGATKTLTVVALTEAPADTNGFVIS